MPKPSHLALRNLRDTYKDEGKVLPLVRRHVMKKLKDEQSGRDKLVLHPSAMAKSDWCGRANYYDILEEKDHNPITPSFKLANTFAYGPAAHDKWQKWFEEMGVLWGKWLCRECKHEFYDLAPLSCVTEGCWASEGFEYLEVPLRADSITTSGHADGALVLDGSDKMVFIEIKTVGLGTVRFSDAALFSKFANGELTEEEVWRRINRPFPTHLKQGMLYLHLAREMGMDVDTIVFIYEWKSTQDSKEFAVTYNPKLIEGILEQAEAVTTALADGTVPPRPHWAEEDGKVCGSCEHRDICWDKEVAPREPAPIAPKVIVRRGSSAKRKSTLRRAAA